MGITEIEEDEGNLCVAVAIIKAKFTKKKKL